MTTIPEQAKNWLDGRAFVTLATVQPDGQPQQSVVWVKRDGGDLLFSTARGRRKPKNLERDPRATALVTDPDDPYRYLEVRGRVTITEQGGRELIDELAKNYLDKERYDMDSPDAVRVVLRLHPEHVVFNAA